MSDYVFDLDVDTQDDLYVTVDPDFTADLTIAAGPEGKPGTAATVTVGTVTTGLSAAVTNSGTSSAAVLDFVLPVTEPYIPETYSGVLAGVQNGVATVFALPEPAATPTQIEVYRNGLREVYGIGFTATASQLTFTTPPLSTDVIAVSYQK